jgi:ribosome-associated protein
MIEDDDIASDGEASAAPSKASLKREAHAVLALAKALVAMDRKRLMALELPEAVRDAALQAQAIKSHSAHKRQLQYLAKQMRKVDHDAIERQLEQLDRAARRQVQHFHEIEQWRDRLIEQGDNAVDSLLARYPNADRQRLRQYIRQARQEQRAQRPPRAARALFRYLRELFDQSSGVGPADGQ